MKFSFSAPSLLAHISSIVLLGFSIPMVMPILASSNTTCPTLKPVFLNTSTNFIAMGHFQEDCKKDSLGAVASFSQAIRLSPQAEEPYYHRANSYYNLGNYQAAVVDYTEVIRQNTGKFGFSRDAYWNRARAYEKLGEKQQAIADLSQLIGDSSTNAEEYLLRGKMHKDLGNKKSAKADYQAAEKLLQQYVSGNFGSGMTDVRYQQMLEQVRVDLLELNS
ncbi:tetratricopeptide repeat protein [Aliinostoc sp. HNIBRCY26]|uniref:tetratricopeptide repeat protein n=1 Tax=Aliinostoc sp. HNIBRCY26 TaxID=3418997 RepID=UPI003D06D1C1